MKTRYILHPASFILSLVLLTALPARAQWIGGDTGVYNTAGNWSPTFNGTFNVNPTSAYDITLNANIAANTALTLSYTGAQNFTLRSDSATNRIFTLSGNWSFAIPTGARTITIGTIAEPITLATGAATRTIATNSALNSVIINATLSGASIFDFTGAGSVTLNADNSGYTGSVRNGGVDMLIGHNNALGSNTFLINNNSARLSASGGARTIANNVTASNDLEFRGSNNITFTGTTTLTNNMRFIGTNTGTSTLGDVFLSNSNVTGRTMNLQGNGTISGVIANFNGSGVAGNVQKSQGGTWTLTNGNSTYTGVTTMSQSGFLEVSKLADGGMASSIGASSNAAANLVFNDNPSNLRYIGTGDSTDRLFTVLVTGALFASGSGAINFTNTGAIAWGPIVNTTRGLTLGGTNTGNNTLSALIQNNGTGVVSITKADAGTWVLSGTNTNTGVTTINAGTLAVTNIADGGVASALGQSTNAVTNLVLANNTTLRYTGGTASTDRRFTVSGTAAGHQATIEASGTGAVTFANATGPAWGANNQTRTLNLSGTNTDNNTIASVIANNGSGAVGITKSGVGKWVLSGANTYTGATTVSAGTLLVNGSLAAGSAVSVASGAILGGSGTINGTTTIQSGGILSPGNSPGLQNMGTLVLIDGGNYNWQVLNATGLAGTGFDTINLTGSLNLAGLTGGTDFNINLWSLSSIGPDVNGNALNFDNTLNQSWTLVTTGNAITGFDASEFTVNVGANVGAGTAGFSNALAGGVFSVALSGDSTDLLLNYTAIPEPSTYAMLGLGLGALVWLRRKNKNKNKKV